MCQVDFLKTFSPQSSSRKTQDDWRETRLHPRCVFMYKHLIDLDFFLFHSLFFEVDGKTLIALLSWDDNFRPISIPFPFPNVWGDTQWRRKGATLLKIEQFGRHQVRLVGIGTGNRPIRGSGSGLGAAHKVEEEEQIASRSVGNDDGFQGDRDDG